MKIGVLLSGCGFMDGTEIHEAVLTLLAIDRAGEEAVCIAPHCDQREVANHLTNQTTQEKRNILVESARIARGKIRDVKTVRSGELDALIFPGGYGAAKNLSDFASKGKDASVHPDVAHLVSNMVNAGKPIGAICIAPALVAAVLKGKRKVHLTIGTDETTAEQLKAMGADHKNCTAREIIVDRENNIVTTPAYMLASRISEAAEGIEKLVKAVVELAAERAKVKGRQQEGIRT
ncbi:MAG: isoprenoid biosynthesis glyoxalase ElbB [Candidatus Omnitrophota bacterium]